MATYRLEQALTYFEKAKTHIRNPEKIVQAAVELNRAREIALPNLLAANIAGSLGLSGAESRTGLHRIYDEKGTKVGSFWVPILWKVKILPSFDPPALLMVLAKDQHFFGGFGASISSGGLAVSYEVVKFQSGWQDSVLHALQKFNLVEIEGAMLSLDGIRYQLEAETVSSKVQIDFGNPHTESLMMLERAIIEVAKDILKSIENKSLLEYMTSWGKYTSGII